MIATRAINLTLHSQEDSPLYAVLSLDRLHLLLLQQEIAVLKPSLDVKLMGDVSGRAGWIDFKGGRWPVYCLSAELEGLLEIPPNQRICVLLKKEDRYFGIVCAQVGTLQAAQLRLSPVPACMQSPWTPIQALTVGGKQVLCVTSAARLWKFIKHSNEGAKAQP